MRRGLLCLYRINGVLYTHTKVNYAITVLFLFCVSAVLLLLGVSYQSWSHSRQHVTSSIGIGVINHLQIFLTFKNK